MPVPQAFSCRDIPEWGSFLESMQANARAGFPADQALLYKASDLLTKWANKPYPPQDFFKYLCGGFEAQWPLEDKFCLYGFVGALFTRSRHFMASTDPEVRKAADQDFQYATTVLGKEGSVDFLDDSPWPVSILDLYININETEFMTYDSYNKKYPVQPPRVPLESIHWQPPVADPLRRQRAMPPEVLIAVVGTHATLSLEPVDILGRFVQDVHLRAVFYGLEPRWCQILGICNQGTTALSQLFKESEKDPYSLGWSKMTERMQGIYAADGNLMNAQLLLCTEPLAGCLILKDVAEAHGRSLPLLGYLGVALLNNCPPEDIPSFWRHFARLSQRSESGQATAVLAVNNLILSEQIHYQTGVRVPYVRAHGLYTGMSYTPMKLKEVLVWRAPLFVYQTTRCTIMRFLQGLPEHPITYRFVEETESVPYKDMAGYRAVVLLPWDHALMTFYELYSAGMPLLLPAAEWMYRLLYQRGQLSVGERMYQSIMPGHTPPHVEFAEAEIFKEDPGPPDPSVGMSSAKAARGVAEDMLTRGMAAEDLETTKQYVKAALELMQDMRYFLAVADNRTHEDSYTSMGVVRRTGAAHKEKATAVDVKQPTTAGSPGADAWHPYTPFQMSTRDSNDWTRMRKGGWWLRRGIRFDAMRYWYQYSDFARFPGLQTFSNVAEFLCLSETLDVEAITATMRRHNEQTLVHSATFWVHSLVELLGRDPVQ